MTRYLVIRRERQGTHDEISRHPQFRNVYQIKFRREQQATYDEISRHPQFMNS